MTNSKNFYGKYRGVVTDNKDPDMQGRIRARVTDALGDKESGWALPCAPFGGSGMGFFAVPDIGANVWIEFERGDPDYPIWLGCWWPGKKDLPTLSASAPHQQMIFKTKAGSSILLDDTPGQEGITLETAKGQKIKITAQGIEINNGQGGTITLNSNTVSINNGALEVS